ncbi:GntP family permease [Granulicella arctica]|uniref:GntP family permease n=1 Tax=Granulicella arctica TaxID=940613 RepID=UPI0021DFD9B6|nr:GntP family permease [Granulicella arctica]
MTTAQGLQLVAALLSVILLTVLVLRVKIHPFLAILCASIFLTVAGRVPVTQAAASFSTGVGATLSQVAVVLGLGAILGQMLAASGGAETIAATLLQRFGEKNLSWAMLLLGFVVGMPVFFEVGLVLLIPIALTVAHRSRRAPIAVALPMLAGLSIVHGLIPPHPAALLAMTIYHADIGRGILYGLLIALPAAVLAGPIYTLLIGRTPVMQRLSTDLLVEEIEGEGRRPGILLASSITLFPVILILIGSLADKLTRLGSPVNTGLHAIGVPWVALLIAVLWSFYALHRTRGITLARMEELSQQSLAPMAGFIVILGAAGGYCRILQDSGIAQTIVSAALRAHLPLILLAWLIAAGIRLATGSATISMITSASITTAAIGTTVVPHPELLAIASGAGSLIFSHVNDGGFWMIKGFLKLSLKETFATWSVMETILSIAGLVLALLLSAILPA